MNLRKQTPFKSKPYLTSLRKHYKKNFTKQTKKNKKTSVSKHTKNLSKHKEGNLLLIPHHSFQLDIRKNNNQRTGDGIW